MPRKPKVQRTPEEKWQIVLEGLKSGNVAETCRKYEIAPTLYYRWKDEVEEGGRVARPFAGTTTTPEGAPSLRLRSGQALRGFRRAGPLELIRASPCSPPTIAL
jgi:transposase-like protein